MSDHGNRHRDAGREDEKQARHAYHAAAAEQVPAQLDDRILGLARLEAGKNRWPARALPWLRPAAFVATVGLSLAVVLELSELATTNGDPAATGRLAETPAAVVDDFASAAQDSTDRIRSIGDNAAERDLQGDRLPNAILPAGEATFCNAEQTASPEDWQRCILALQQAGRNTAADIETQRLRDAFPDFPPQE